MSRTYTITSQSGQTIDVNTREYVARTLQNARNLLCMHLGECPYDRKSGLDAGLLHMNAAQVRRYVFEEVQRVLRWEPDVTLISARPVFVDHETAYIEATVSIKEG